MREHRYDEEGKTLQPLLIEKEIEDLKTHPLLQSEAAKQRRNQYKDRSDALILARKSL